MMTTGSFCNSGDFGGGVVNIVEKIRMTTALKDVRECFAIAFPSQDSYELFVWRMLERYRPTPVGNNCVPKRQVLIGLQVEHTLVRPGGRGIASTVEGDTSWHGEQLWVSITHAHRLAPCHVILDYSWPNLVHCAASINSDKVIPVQRMRYFPPLFCDLLPQQTAQEAKQRRPCRMATTFINPNEPRRAKFLLDLAKADEQEKKDSYNRSNLDPVTELAFYESLQVLVNVHQTDHHLTLEEIRVLPALLKGTVIVSEDVPLRQSVPYHEFIVWGSYNDLPLLAAKVSRDYDHWHESLFGGVEKRKKLEGIIHGLQRRVQDVVASLWKIFPEG